MPKLISKLYADLNRMKQNSLIQEDATHDSV